MSRAWPNSASCSGRRSDLQIRRSGHIVQGGPVAAMCWADIFQACQHASGAVQRLGSRFGSSHRGVAMTIDLPLLRMKDDRPGQAMLVYLACSEPGSRRWWT